MPQQKTVHVQSLEMSARLLSGSGHSFYFFWSSLCVYSIWVHLLSLLFVICIFPSLFLFISILPQCLVLSPATPTYTCSLSSSGHLSPVPSSAPSSGVCGPVLWPLQVCCESVRVLCLCCRASLLFHNVSVIFKCIFLLRALCLSSFVASTSTLFESSQNSVFLTVSLMHSYCVAQTPAAMEAAARCLQRFP